MNFLTNIFLPVLLSCSITLFLIPCWIRVCNKWNLFEKNDDRKLHRRPVPTLGGLAIYAGIVIAFLLIGEHLSMPSLKFLIAGSLILFFTGFFDDLIDIPAARKLILQIIAAGLIAFGGIRIHSLYGMLGINELSGWIQYVITILFIVSITNAYNLVDGIDGLAASLGIMASAIFGAMFYYLNYTDFAILSFCMTGALLGFLRYNFHPAKIFMGDTGSLIIGFFLAALAISLLNINEIPDLRMKLISPAFVAAVLFVPLYDVLRVSVIRILTGSSPLRADRNHLHHMICNQGFGQRIATLLIVGINLVFVTLSIVFYKMNINLFVVMCLCFGMITINTLVMTRLAAFYGRLGGRVHRKEENTTVEGLAK